jgi:putative DNA modification/repair radical SAM protein
MERFYEIVRRLREEENFNGYIHLKAIPGADREILDKVAVHVDRLSVNIELPTDEGLKMLAPQKRKKDILLPMTQINQGITRYQEERKVFRSAPKYVPAGQTTQLIVGATRDSDYRILNLSENLYQGYGLKRVYYSAFVPVSTNPLLPQIKAPPLLRENRLYQADWLLRFYGFQAAELLSEDRPDFDLLLDPKCDWALRNMHLFPLEVNRASYELLLKVPGIGVKSARRIISSRRFAKVGYDDLKKMGVALKRAKHFITIDGRHYGISSMDDVKIRSAIIGGSSLGVEQLSIFDLSGGA